MPGKSSAQYKITDQAELLVAALPPLDRHPGQFIRDVLLPEYGLSVARLAEAIKVNRPNLSNVLHGKSDVSRELAYRLGALMRDEVADLLIAYQNAWDIKQERDRREELRREIVRLPDPDRLPKHMRPGYREARERRADELVKAIVKNLNKRVSE